jgi:acyl dehydratase
VAINREHLKAMSFPDITQAYGVKECMFYALSVGLGQDPLDPWQLGYVHEPQLKVLPTMSVVLASPGFWQQKPETGINWKGIVHGEQRLMLHEPLPVQATVLGRLTVDEVVDKGDGRGALLHSSRKLFEKDTGKPLCTMQSTAFCRFDGGFSSGASSVQSPVTPLEPVPDLPPDYQFTVKTQPSAALLYRLNGDFNPLHSDPQVAKASGFDRPILHGLCTYAIAAYSVMALTANSKADLRQLDVRFTSPVYPGETLITELWLDGIFRARSGSCRRA